jgi:methionyl-tRNA formyltransferase
MLVAAGDGCVELLRVKPAGRSDMPAADFVRGVPALRGTEGRDGGCAFAGT